MSRPGGSGERAGAALLRCLRLSKSFPGVAGTIAAVRDVTFEVNAGAFFTMLGPSGCGKTTTLRCIAGLERPDAGEVWHGGEVWSSRAGPRGTGRFRPAHRRNVGMVFQSYAIWPHMSVFDNVAFALRARFGRRLTESDIRRRVLATLELVRLAAMERRAAVLLSGGEQQRVALARALVTEPSVLLLDEPLSNLDAGLRAETRGELKRLQRDLSITTVYVTHDQIEALSMSDTVAVMHNGAIVQAGTPRDLYDAPQTAFVARFLGGANLIEGVIAGPPHNGTAAVRTPLGVIMGRLSQAAAAVADGERVVIVIRPEDVSIRGDVGPADGTAAEWVGRVWDVAFLGGAAEVIVKAAEHSIRAQISGPSPVAVGDTVRVAVPAERCLIAAADTAAAPSSTDVPQ